MHVQKLLLAAAAALTLAAPAAALADSHDGSGDHRGDVHRGYDNRDRGVGERHADRDGRRFNHRHHHHHRWEDRQWR